jgi:histidine triad (HIT) family protein
MRAGKSDRAQWFFRRFEGPLAYTLEKTRTRCFTGSVRVRLCVFLVENRSLMAYDSTNIFAKILRGEAPCIKLFEDELTLSFMDIMPQADGHVLVIAKEAAETLLDLSDDGARACVVTARRMAIAVKKALAADGVLVAQMNGAAAGQTVPHVHFHVIPRTAGAAFRLHATERADDASLNAFAEKIRAALS